LTHFSGSAQARLGLGSDLLTLSLSKSGSCWRLETKPELVKEKINFELIGIPLRCQKGVRILFRVTKSQGFFIERQIAMTARMPRTISRFHPTGKRFSSLLCSTHLCPSMIIKRMDSTMKTMMPWPHYRV
jgi:hypothetical protein